MRRIAFLFFTFLFSFFTSIAEARITLPSFFSDGMVLQQQTECNIWGKSETGKSVVVITSCDKKSYSTLVDQNGDFSIMVDLMTSRLQLVRPASRHPKSLVLAMSAHSTMC